MKKGVMHGIALGAVVGVSALTLLGAVDVRTRKNVRRFMMSAAQRMGDQAEKIMK